MSSSGTAQVVSAASWHRSPPPLGPGATAMCDGHCVILSRSGRLAEILMTSGT
ncbi:hypothetical protein EI94DRAFT_1747707, partial [Lactarius quietus]